MGCILNGLFGAFRAHISPSTSVSQLIGLAFRSDKFLSSTSMTCSAVKLTSGGVILRATKSSVLSDWRSTYTGILDQSNTLVNQMKITPLLPEDVRGIAAREAIFSTGGKPWMIDPLTGTTTYQSLHDAISIGIEMDSFKGLKCIDETDEPVGFMLYVRHDSEVKIVYTGRLSQKVDGCTPILDEVKKWGLPLTVKVDATLPNDRTRIMFYLRNGFMMQTGQENDVTLTYASFMNDNM